MLKGIKKYLSQRNKKRSANKQKQEFLDFLPAALEIQNRPASPAGRILGWSLMSLFSIGVVWAIVGEVDIVATAQGRIVPSSRVKQIQPLEKGVVKHIFVREGESVTAGQPLIELDQVLTLADQERLRNELQFSELTLLREKAFLAALNKKTSSKESIPSMQQALNVLLPVSLSETQKQVQLNILQQQWLDYQAQLGALNSQVQTRIAQKQASEATVEKLQATLPIISKRTAALKTLLEKSLAAEAQYLELEQQRIEIQQNLVAEQATVRQLNAAILESEQRKAALTAQLQTETLMKVEDAERKVATTTQELNKANDLNAKQILYAPVSGKVQQLAVHTVGGVVTEAQPLMLIVPNEDFLEVEATLQNKDIGFVHEGQIAEVKVNTFPFTKYGIIDAEVLTITADAVEDEKQGLVYKIRLKMKTSQLWVEKRWVDLLPGMLVSAEVKTGKRRLIEFVTAPLLRYRDESVRER